MAEKKKMLPRWAQNLVELRHRSGMKQEDFAEYIGVTRAALAKYETGVNRPSQETLLCIAKKTRVSLDFLMGEAPAAGSLPLRQEPQFEGVELLRECDKEERAFLAMLRQLGDEGKAKLYFYGVDLLEREGSLTDLLQEEKK